MSFLQGRDGNEWVWVMGEHKSDKTIEQLLEEEAIQKAERQAEKELEEIRSVHNKYTDMTLIFDFMVKVYLICVLLLFDTVNY